MTNSSSMRVVLDTNVLLSACLKPEGLEAQVVGQALRGEIQACVTQAILDEYADVLGRDKFRAVRERAELLLGGIAGCALRVETSETLSAASDEDDNRFLECAAAARADYVITGNLRHYPPECGATKVVNARGFVERAFSG